jgi:hypothetical protein
MPKTSFADIATDWERLITTVVNNKDDLQVVDPYRSQLETELVGARTASIRQAAAKAEAQQATRDLEGALNRGKDLAERLRTGILSRYGRRSEKLTEFQIKPLRPNKKKASDVKGSKATAGKSSGEVPSKSEGEKPAPQGSTTTGPSQ